ncbi:unnamed protein product [Enterobius vermicularis]|uniref:RRM domain-containing protein n=1 Tax=Enterobius vermicularis TaxID=51028 RepID=A0A0N4V745_ENTVE|nr:unnamed protein product [Enterobius vermicularis]
MHPYNIALLPPTFKEAMHFSPLTSTWPNLKESRASDNFKEERDIWGFQFFIALSALLNNGFRELNINRALLHGIQVRLYDFKSDRMCMIYFRCPPYRKLEEKKEVAFSHASRTNVERGRTNGKIVVDFEKKVAFNAAVNELDGNITGHIYGNSHYSRTFQESHNHLTGAFPSFSWLSLLRIHNEI